MPRSFSLARIKLVPRILLGRIDECSHTPANAIIEVFERRDSAHVSLTHWSSLWDLNLGTLLKRMYTMIHCTVDVARSKIYVKARPQRKARSTKLEKCGDDPTRIGRVYDAVPNSLLITSTACMLNDDVDNEILIYSSCRLSYCSVLLQWPGSQNTKSLETLQSLLAYVSLLGN